MRTWIVAAAVQAVFVGACLAQPVYPVTEKMKELLKKNESFGLKKYPISMWNYQSLAKQGEHFTEAEMQSLADAGLTVPQSPYFDPDKPAEKAQMLKMLDWAAKRDMKLIVCDPRCLGMHEKAGKPPANYAEGVKKALADFGKHPGLFGYFIGDEPSGEGMEALAECQRIQKQLAPHLHSFLNHLPAMGPDWGKFLDQYVRLSNTDIIGYDRYTQMNSVDVQAGINTYYESLRVYREASLRHGVPFWNTLLSTGHYLYKVPNLDEFRWQFNTTLASGANGIVWFFWYLSEPGENYRLAPMDEFWEKTDAYKHIRRVQQNFHKTYGDLFNRLVSTRVSFYPEAMGGGEAWKPNDLVQGLWPAYEGDHPVLIGEFTDAQGRRYVMVVNNSQTRSERVLVKFPLKAKLYSYRYGSEGKEYLFSDGTEPKDGHVEAWTWLAPGQETLFRVELAK
ncbi:MAG: hypothetical protein NTV86_14890 [Planctomycetota bacterium]|nr:hypothetical protein [Planctomycetota bacterium]